MKNYSLKHFNVLSQHVSEYFSSHHSSTFSFHFCCSSSFPPRKHSFLMSNSWVDHTCEKNLRIFVFFCVHSLCFVFHFFFFFDKLSRRVSVLSVWKVFLLGLWEGIADGTEFNCSMHSFQDNELIFFKGSGFFYQKNFWNFTINVQ